MDLALALDLVVVEEEEEEEEDLVVFRLLFLLSGVGFLVRFMVGIVRKPALNGVYEKGPKTKESRPVLRTERYRQAIHHNQSQWHHRPSA